LPIQLTCNNGGVARRTPAGTGWRSRSSRWLKRVGEFVGVTMQQIP
jgi:hypothetical protein